MPPAIANSITQVGYLVLHNLPSGHPNPATAWGLTSLLAPIASNVMWRLFPYRCSLPSKSTIRQWEISDLTLAPVPLGSDGSKPVVWGRSKAQIVKLFQFFFYENGQTQSVSGGKWISLPGSAPDAPIFVLSWRHGRLSWPSLGADMLYRQSHRKSGIIVHNHRHSRQELTHLEPETYRIWAVFPTAQAGYRIFLIVPDLAEIGKFFKQAPPALRPSISTRVKTNFFNRWIGKPCYCVILRRAGWIEDAWRCFADMFGAI